MIVFSLLCLIKEKKSILYLIFVVIKNKWWFSKYISLLEENKVSSYHAVQTIAKSADR